MVGIAVGVLLVGIFVVGIGVSCYDSGKEAKRNEAAENNAGHWVVNAVTGVKAWKWGPAPGTWQHRQLAKCTDFRKDEDL